MMKSSVIKDIDKRIISIMDFDGRLSYTQIGKKIGKTKQYVRQRIEKLKKEGIITGTEIIIDISKIGYEYIRLLVKYSKITREEENRILDFFKGKKEVSWLVKTGGEYDLAASIMADKIRDYEKVLDAFCTEFNKNLLSWNTTIATKIWHLPHPFLREYKKAPIITGGSSKIVDLDSRDKSLLRILMKNGSQKSVTIGKKLGLTPATVISRMKRLENKGIIKGFRPKIDFSKLGYQNYKVFFMVNNLSSEFINRFANYLKQRKEISYITKALGEAALEIELFAVNNYEFNKILMEIRTKFSDDIIDFRFLEVYKIERVNYAPF